MFSSVFRSSSRTTSTTLVQKMRRTSGHISLVCALLLAGVVSPAWAKPGKSKVTEKPAVKTATKPSAKSAGNKNSNAKTTASAHKDKSNGKKTASVAATGKAGKNGSGASSKRQAQTTALASATDKVVRNSKADSRLTAHNKKGDKSDAKAPSTQDLRKQIAALQAKGKGRTLSKIQKQQLARLTTQAQQAEKAERQEKMEQARAQRLAAAQKEKERQLQARATAARQAAVVAPTAIQQAPQPGTSPALQEDLMALQATTSGNNANTAVFEDAPAVVPAATTAVAPQANPESTPAALGTTPAAQTHDDPLQALLNDKQAEASAAATAVASVAPTPVVASVVTPVAPPPVQTATVPTRQPDPAPSSSIIRVSVPQRNSLGQIQGLSQDRGNFGPDLYSSVAFAMDQKTGQILVNKNGHFVSPIASITKLMTAVITMDSNLPMDEMITITDEDVDRLKGSRSRLAVGTTLSRQELLHLSLMSSENRAAHALGRTYPGGLSAAVRAMNQRALMLGMRETRYVEPTGLSSSNQSSAHDLALLVKAAYRYPLIRNYTTYPGANFAVQGKMLRFNNTNRLIHSPEWNIGLQKTGFISEAGRCVVMQSNINGRNVIIVLLDSSATNLRAQDAESIRYWVQQNGNRPGRDGSSIIAQARTY